MATKIKNKKMLNSEHLLITHQKCQKQFKLTKRETATLMVNYSMNQDSSQQQNNLQEESSIITKIFQINTAHYFLKHIEPKKSPKKRTLWTKPECCFSFCYCHQPRYNFDATEAEKREKGKTPLFCVID
jgi:hypothetical protein